MPTSQKTRSKEPLIQKPELLANALANVVVVESGREIVLGQAWLAAPGRLITCGHVVERYIQAPSMAYLKFPASGNKYQISRIRLHPSFVRQPDQLVKFDVALLEVNLNLPESQAQPLPFSYEQAIQTNQSLWAIRFPAHLGQLSAAPQPLTQSGRFLGPLRTHDSFHLLHDLPLSPGDSGAPISDGTNIVAVHCGDTATIPGLNLPTTAIRLSLWIDALRELGIQETIRPRQNNQGSFLFPCILAFIIAAATAAYLTDFYLSEQLKKVWSYSQPSLAPIKISFNEPIDSYKLYQDVEINVVPDSNCYLYLFNIDNTGNVSVLYPQKGEEAFLARGALRTINHFGRTTLVATPSPDMLHLVVVDGSKPEAKELADQILKSADWPSTEREGKPLLIKGPEFIKRIEDLKASQGETILYQSFIGPHSN